MKHTTEWKLKMSKIAKEKGFGKWMGGRKGKKCNSWKGNNITCILMKHKRIEQKYGKPKYCEICKRTDRKLYEWANKDHKYSLKKEDWMRLCRGCHMKYDHFIGKRFVSEETKIKIATTEKITKSK